MRSYGKKKSLWLTALRTLHSRAVTDTKRRYPWTMAPEDLASTPWNTWNGDPVHNAEEIAEMQEDMRSVIAILDKYKKVGR